jgi:uncharacterized membrane-anchored protein YjiN (DUF445 family)
VITTSANPFPAMAAERLHRLRRMKAIATGMLLIAAAIYVLCRAYTDGHGAWGYVEAAAEASMVGGLADWFAVTALFRHPLRIPIPHTAIIPAKKDLFGEGLADFVQQYFLTTEIVSERIAAARVPRRVGDWLAEPTHAQRLAEELSNAVSGFAGMLRDDEVRHSVAAFADRRLRELDVAGLTARLLDALCDAGQHQASLTTFLRGARKFLDANRDEFREWLGRESPEWVPDWVDDRVFGKAFSLLQDFLGQVIDDPSHALRAGFDTQLRDLAERLRSDPEQIAKVEAARDQLLEHPRINEYLAQLWDSLKDLLLRAADDPDSDLRRSTAALTMRLGEVLRDDPEVTGRVDAGLQRLTGHIVTHYADDLTDIISSTVERWDTEETSRRLELQVGRDLQFVRVNGTVVGALAGVAIYAVTQLF